MNLRAHRLILRDILSFEQLDIEFGDSMTIVRAHNGAGKTNLARSILSISDGGMDATLIRTGQPEGEVVWVLTEDGKPWTIHERLNRETGAHRHVIRPDGTKDNAAKRFIDGVLNGMSANPVKFVTATPTERARVFLEQMRVRLTPEHLQRIGVKDLSLLNLHGLQALRKIDKDLREKREAHGRDGRQAKDAAIKLSATLPSIEYDGQELKAATERHNEIQRQISTQVERARAIEARKTDEIAAKYKAELVEVDRQIAELQAQRRELILKEKQERSTITANIEREIQSLTNDLYEEARAKTVEINTLEQRRDAHIQAQGTRNHIAEYEVDADRHRTAWQALSSQLQAAADIEKELLSDLPIKSVVVIDGELYKDDVPFPRWNEQAQWALALQLAKMAAGDLKFCIIDGLNFLDHRNREAFHKAAVNSGLQFLVTEVNVDCECGHPGSVHEPKCQVTECKCERFVDPGMVIERVGEVPAVVRQETVKKGRAR